MKRLLRCCCLAALLIPYCPAFAQEQASPVGTKVIVVASDVELASDEGGVRRAQYGDVATVAKVDGQKLWLQEKGGDSGRTGHPGARSHADMEQAFLGHAGSERLRR